ncbi:bifunctional 2-polyprenyl-6-hydroxyphenol methylase/3-demethylubiquinol 3-O-methyltransferase UbiG [Glaciimonas sp. PAMC28666]|uniref:class I SAM-dependent methyltransferase n=1 Tax=Glaciimonas sp. PAMC28666 TaxID=2807626 RepID=UPI001F04943F|nr:methyltransferase domain-containing protein [Glaciimonas sp. PAMC28666]
MTTTITTTTTTTMVMPVSSWVRRFGAVIPAAQVLDLACGDGRHSKYLTAAGKNMLAVDRNPGVLAEISAKGITTQLIDLEAGDDLALAELFQPARFSGVVVTNYLHRPLVSLLLNSIADQGVLLYETFADGNQQFGRPSNPEFLLMTGELLQWLAADTMNSWHVLAYEEGYVTRPKPAMIQRILAVKGTGRSLGGLQLD